MFFKFSKVFRSFQKEQMILHWKQLKHVGILSSIPVTTAREILISKSKPTEGTLDRKKTSQLLFMLYITKQSRHPF